MSNYTLSKTGLEIDDLLATVDDAPNNSITGIETGLVTADTIFNHVSSAISAAAITPIFSKSFESTDQEMPEADTTLSVAHGLSEVPKIFAAYLKCVKVGGRDGYSEGELVNITTLNEATQVNYFADGTNIGLRNMHTNFYIVDKDGGSYVYLQPTNATDAADFKVVFRAYA